ncbi:MAG: GIY-YIG nuclease family protein [Bauldia sp.]|nr:GIY-YIG nuclease family protein [Bauldia sp.]
MKPFYVYIICNKPFGTLYIGSTDDIGRRIYEHREGLFPGFSKKYGLKILVWYELAESRETAFTRERQLKKWNRDWKLRLIAEMNPEWRDLYEELLH